MTLPDQPVTSPSSNAVAGGCPACGAVLVTERGAIPWCDQCAWNIDIYEAPPGSRWWQRRIGAVSHRIAYRLTMGQFRGLRGATVQSTVRSWGAARFVSVAFSVAFYLLVVGLAAVGVWLVQLNFPSPTIVIGALLIAIVAYLAPRFGGLPVEAEVVTRDQAPALFALVDRVAELAGTPRPQVVAVDPWINAMTMEVGLRRRRALVLGLGLWGALEPQQRVALLAHEMGHFANGDSRRSLLTEPALTSLARLAELFVLVPGPARLRGFNQPAGGRVATGLVNQIIEPLVGWFMRLVSSGLVLTQLGVRAIVLRDGQRREYLADRSATRLAGTQGMVGLLDLLTIDPSSVIASRARAQETEAGWRAAAQQLRGEFDPRRLRRLRQLSTRRDTSLLASHPPTGLRAWLVEDAGWVDPGLRLAAEESDRIDAELAAHYRRARRDLATSRI